ncbi:hypothetical protein [uncultured Amnibacterium sp.]|uniref:COG4705 family protein n=1 Tax=uncultured Amnibacterium sp. TaxID=1631851 RepID=UPI0035CA40B8
MTSIASAGSSGAVAPLRRLSRVPQPSASFWLVKVLTTGMGETTSDYLVRTFAPELVVPVAAAVLAAVLLLQLRLRRYHPAMYWTTALMVSIVGTMAADVLHVGFGLPYLASVIGFGILLAVVFIAWRRAEGTLSVHDITTGRRERFYWAAVITTFALGTAAGDLTASTLGLGYLGSAVLFAVAFAAPGVVYALVRRGPVVTFWIAYVLTRPLGASVADWFAVPTPRGGLDLGAGPVSLCLLAVFVLAVALLSRRGRPSSRRRRHLA